MNNLIERHLYGELRESLDETEKETKLKNVMRFIPLVVLSRISTPISLLFDGDYDIMSA